MTKIYKLATRGSALALWQAHFVQENLKKHHISSEVHIVKTSGDKYKNKTIASIGGKGVFVKELEEELLSHSVDLAVHSLKDLPAETRKPFTLPCYFPRHPSQDVIIFSPQWESRLRGAHEKEWQMEDVRNLGALKVGTGSLRRECLLHEANPKIKTVSIRGNVDTRLAKLKEGQWDAIVLAKAAIHRLPIVEGFPHFTLDSSWFVPCAGQGVIVAETLETHELAIALKKFSDPKAETMVTIERKILAFLGGDCNLPVGVHVFYRHHELCCDLVVFNKEGAAMRMYVTQGESKDAFEFSELIWGELQHAKVDKFLND